MTAAEQIQRATELGAQAFAARMRFLPYRDAELVRMLEGRERYAPEGEADTPVLLDAWLGGYRTAARGSGDVSDLADEQRKWAAELGAAAFGADRLCVPGDDPVLARMLDLRGAWSRPFPGEASWYDVVNAWVDGWTEAMKAKLAAEPQTGRKRQAH